MGLFSKKEEVPSIQPAATLPELPKQQEPAKQDLPELPSFPANSKTENINQEMVKSAVADTPSPGEEEVHVEIPQGMQVTEEPAGIPPVPTSPPVAKIPPAPTAPAPEAPQVPRSREITESLPELPKPPIIQIKISDRHGL